MVFFLFGLRYSGNVCLSQTTIFDISVNEDEAEKRKADQGGHGQKEPCSQLQELTRQTVVSLFCCVHDLVLGGWIASTTRER